MIGASAFLGDVSLTVDNGLAILRAAGGDFLDPLPITLLGVVVTMVGIVGASGVGALIAEKRLLEFVGTLKFGVCAKAGECGGE
jgi:hypothetical protein